MRERGVVTVDTLVYMTIILILSIVIRGVMLFLLKLMESDATRKVDENSAADYKLSQECLRLQS